MNFATFNARVVRFYGYVHKMPVPLHLIDTKAIKRDIDEWYKCDASLPEIVKALDQYQPVSFGGILLCVYNLKDGPTEDVWVGKEKTRKKMLEKFYKLSVPQPEENKVPAPAWVYRYSSKPEFDSEPYEGMKRFDLVWFYANCIAEL